MWKCATSNSYNVPDCFTFIKLYSYEMTIQVLGVSLMIDPAVFNV